MIRRTRLGVALIVLMSLLALACGNDTSSDEGSPAGGETSNDDGSSTSDTPSDGGSEGDGIVDAAFGQALRATEPRDGGTLSIGTVTSFETLDFSVSAGTAASLIGRFVFETLMEYTDDGSVVPLLAESLETEDGVEWTMTLQPDLVFHDGTPFNAAAVVAHLERLGAEESTSSAKSDIARIAEIEEVDDLTLRFVLDDVWASFPQIFTSYAGMIPSPARVEELGSDWGFKPAGVGPYIVEEFQSGVEAVLVKNPDYRIDGKPHVDRVELRPSLDSQARFAAIQSGDFDLVLSQSSSDFERAREAGLTVLVQDHLTATNLVWNMQKDPISDIRFREAVIRAVDLEAINEVVYDGQRPTMRGMFAPSHPHYVDTDWPEFDPDRARELVDELVADGVDPTFTSTVWGTPEYARMGALMQQMLADVGITMETTTGDQPTMLTEAYEGSYTSQLRYFSVNIGTDASLAGQLRSGSRQNISFLADPQIDGLLDELDATLDPDGRVPLYAQIQERIRETLPMMPLHVQTSAFLLSPEIGGFPGAQADVVEYFDIREVWFK